MRFDTYTLHVPASVTNGVAMLARDMMHKTVQISGTFTQTVKLQGSLDGTNWFDIKTSISAPTMFNVVDSTGAEFAVSHLRIVTTAYTDGAATAVLCGANMRD